MNNYYTRVKPGFYRSREGAIFGVCRGIADYFDFSLFWTRMLTLILLVVTGFWPVIVLYLICALLMKPEPESRYHY